MLPQKLNAARAAVQVLGSISQKSKFAIAASTSGLLVCTRLIHSPVHVHVAVWWLQRMSLAH